MTVKKVEIRVLDFWVIILYLNNIILIFHGVRIIVFEWRQVTTKTKSFHNCCDNFVIFVQRYSKQVL